MTNEFKLFLFGLGFVLCASRCTFGESSKCLMVYKEGGAPAVFQSPKCPRWKLSNYASGPRTERCQSAMHQGRRKSQEDRTFCALDVQIPFPGRAGLTEVMVGMVAVFDGHNGAEASEMASKLLLEYFTLHAYFLLDTTFSIISKKSVGRLPNNGEQDIVSEAFNWDELDQHVSDLGRFKLKMSAIFDGSFHLEILKESLLRAIHDIDATFSKEASRNNLDSGSTATVILIADAQILVANVGDSKAFLCTEKFQSPSEAKATLLRLYRQKRQSYAIPRTKDYDSFKLVASNGLAHFSAKELTRDHHPDRDDERSRVESAGGYVLEWGGVSRVNGQLAVSRAIGDVSFKSYGVIPAPEVTDWQPLSVNDSYLVAASDGIFEKLSPQDVCDLLWELHTDGNVRSELAISCPYSLADCIVNTAFEKGSVDNMAAVVVPFTSTVFSDPLLKEKCAGEGEIDHLALGLQKFNYEWSESERAHPVIAKFDRLLVEGKHSSVGCFYLSENLDENVDYTFRVKKFDQKDMYDLPQALPEAFDHRCGGPLNLYKGQNMCAHFGMTTNGGRDQCINPEGFASFLGLLESIPFHNIGSDYGSFEHALPDLRYILKKRFDRGSYGEVWLAFHWNCSECSNASNWGPKNKKCSFNTVHLDTYGRTSQTNSSAHDCNASPPNDDLFILKRIMVERGTTVYLSGLREKYFGEMFLNASSFLVGSLSAGMSDSFFKESQPNFYDLSETNESAAHEIGNAWTFENIFPNKNRQRDDYEEGLNHIARYVESFESRSNEIWLVFRHEGVSLSKILYTSEEMEDEANDEHAKRIQVLRPSKWWHWLKTTEAGQKEMRNVIWQLLVALKSCHDRNITHRDIKPENMVICFEDQDSGRCLKGSPSGDKKYTTKMRIIDFGSAMDEFTVKNLYGSGGPSRAEQTDEYAPPEAFLNVTWYQGPTSTTLKYDMWSVGVVILELILGSPDVFKINAFTRALLDRHLEGWNEDLKELAYKLRSFMEMCILIPGSSSKHHRACGTKDRDEVSPASWKCSEEFFSHQIKSRDPLKIGFPNIWALRLVRQLLLWDPEDRLSVDDALQHPYFQSPQR
ncbi:hypothetical protein F0562_021220 [Nyssa sinensis]|uniref:PPM-type phosphatase domain-containing protein n=1 Tax=Nyssa sinensis TaxID=561372 RepID=A0A5J5BJH5_9ASTE|nr:hypothetical protein F0562_021220 [Nyssa sinensis]